MPAQPLSGCMVAVWEEGRVARPLSLSPSLSPSLVPHYRYAFFACAVVASLAPCQPLELTPRAVPRSRSCS